MVANPTYTFEVSNYMGYGTGGKNEAERMRELIRQRELVIGLASAWGNLKVQSTLSFHFA